MLKEQADVANAIHFIRAILGIGGFSRLAVEYIILVIYIFFISKLGATENTTLLSAKGGNLFPVIS